MVLRWVVSFLALTVMACADRPTQARDTEIKNQAVLLNRIEIELAMRGLSLSKQVSAESVESDSTWQYYLTTEVEITKVRSKLKKYQETVDTLVARIQTSPRRPTGWEVYLEKQKAAKIWLQVLEKKITLMEELDSEIVNLDKVPKGDVYFYHLSEETRLAYYKSALNNYEVNLKKIEERRGHSLLHPPIELMERCRDVNYRNELISDLSSLAGYIISVRDYLRTLRGTKIMPVEDRQKMLRRLRQELMSVQTLQSAIIELGIDFNR